MIIRKAFKFRLKTKPQIESKLSRFAGCCRFVWNKGLAMQKQRLTQKQPCLSYTKMAAALRGWKNQDETAFLKDCHWQPLQQTLMTLDKALQQAFDKKNTKRFPQFKKKGRHDALRYPQGFKLMSVHKWLFLPISLLGENFNPRNIRHMPAVKIFVCLKRDQNISFVDGHYIDGKRVYLPKIGWAGFFKPQNTSRTCPLCRHTEKNNRKTQAVFACLKCGYKNNADHVAAINILAAGQAVSACGDIGPVTVQAQESLLL